MIFKWLSDRNNITFLIAIIGFVMSVYNFVANAFQNSVRANIEISNAFRIQNNQRCLDVLHVKIINLSKQPIVISRMDVSNHLGKGSFGSLRRELIRIEKTGSAFPSKVTWSSDALPVKIEGQGFANLLIMADSGKPTLTTTGPNTITIHTPRRKLRTTLSIARFSAVQDMSECREPDC